MRIKLATYNIHRCVGGDGAKKPARIRTVLEEIRPDIVALQEVEYRTAIHELGFTSEQLRFEAVHGPNVTSGKSKYGNVLLTRYPVGRINKIDLSYPGQEKRGALDVNIDCNGLDLRVIATHLGLSPVERRMQARKLLSAIHIDQNVSCCTVLMGDMNEWFLWGRPLRWLHGFFGINASPPTFPSRFPVLALDRIWAHPSENLRQVKSHRSPLSRIASDHLPLMATLRLGA